MGDGGRGTGRGAGSGERARMLYIYIYQVICGDQGAPFPRLRKAIAGALFLVTLCGAFNTKLMAV